MTAKRHYNLLCPIARALDVVGDRWTLLILRDLHAGPARFNELHEGLGIATNLLTTRLGELVDSGLVNREGDPGRYELTDLGRGTDRVLWELAQFGGRLGRAADPREPGNLRTIALPLRMMLESVTRRPELTARLLIDDGVFTIVSTSDGLDVRYGETSSPADLVVRAGYEDILDVGEGLVTVDEFAKRVDVIDGAEHAAAFLALMGAAAN